MSRTMNEVQVLKKLGIDDFRHLTKDKVISMATMLDRMDPEVAKKVLEQFPDFANTMKQVFTELRQSLDESVRMGHEASKSYYYTCDAIIQSCQKMLDKEDLDFDSRTYILDKMLLVAELKSDQNAKDKQFTMAMSALKTVSSVVLAFAMAAALGGNVKIDLSSLKKLSI